MKELFSIPEKGIHYYFYTVKAHCNSRNGQEGTYNQYWNEKGVFLIFKSLVENYRCKKHQGDGVSKKLDPFYQQGFISPHVPLGLGTVKIVIMTYI